MNKEIVNKFIENFELNWSIFFYVMEELIAKQFFFILCPKAMSGPLSFADFAEFL
jgi:hypothetical protein